MSSACPTCGAPLRPAASPAGLCPVCLLSNVMHDVGADAALDDESDTLFSPGVMLGSFRIVALLGRGGMATVYEAYDTRLERAVALKVLPPHFLHDRNLARRFEQEARVIARLEHPAIVPIYASGTDQDIPWMSMRLLHGGNMGTLLKNSPPNRVKAIGILREIAEALDYAHAHGVVHRDIKPTNILFDRDDRPCVGDFGLAQMLEGSPVDTRAGVVMGTPHYMAPEQAEGKGVDYRCDVYSLGILAYEMLLGRPPFTGDSPLSVLMKQVSEPLPVPAQGELPEGILGAIQKAAAKDPSERWASAGAFARALESGLGATSVSSSTVPQHDASREHAPRWLAAATPALRTAAVVTLLAIAVVGVLVRAPWRDDPSKSPGSDIELSPDAPVTENPPIDAPQPELNPPVGRGSAVRPRTDNPPIDKDQLKLSTPPPRDGAEPAPPPAEEAGSPSTTNPTIQASEPPTEKRVEESRQPDTTTAVPTAASPNADVVQPRRLRTVVPTYPEVALAAQIEGDVVLQLTVRADGTISDVVVVRSAHRLLDAAAISAVRHYEYAPGRRNGVAVPVTIRTTVSFKLR